MAICSRCASVMTRALMSEARLNERVVEGVFTDDLELRPTPRLAETWKVTLRNLLSRGLGFLG